MAQTGRPGDPVSRTRHDSGSRVRHGSGNLAAVHEDSVFEDEDTQTAEDLAKMEIVTTKTRRWTISIPNVPLGNFTGFYIFFSVNGFPSEIYNNFQSFHQVYMFLYSIKYFIKCGKF